MSEQTNKILINPASELAQLRSRTLWQTVSEGARRDPCKCALVAADDAGNIQRLAYEGLVERAGNLSAGLASIGVRRGDRVVLWMTNTLEWVVSSLAIMRLGAAVVPINTFLKPVEVQYVIAQSGARHLLMLDAFRKLRLPEMLGEICPEFISAKEPGFLNSNALPDLRNVVVFGRGGYSCEAAFDHAALEALGARDERARALAERMERETCGSDLGMIKYTSGSTGFPKGVMLEQGGIVANGTLHSRRIGVGGSDVYFSMMPFFHAGGSIWGLMTMMANGGTLVFTEAFNPQLALSLIESEQATVWVSVLSKEVCEVASQQGRQLRSVRIGDISSEIARRVLPNATFSFRPFGLTETYGPAAVTSPADSLERQNTTCGRMLDGNELRVVDPDTGLDVPPGATGEAWLRGNIMRGYWNNPEQTARALTADGWLRSEDLVRIDGEGYVSYVGRLKLMLKVGGENVSIEEVERVICGHEAVAACASVGVADERKGEAVRAYVTLRPQQTLERQTLRAWLEPRLARFKMPREIIFVDSLPRLANGKLDRISLSQWARQEMAS
jgi:fatty-acyl-CoA synthase